MNPLLLIVGIFLFVSGIVLGRQSQSPSSKILSITKSFQAQTTPIPSPTPTETITPTETQPPQQPTQTIQKTPAPTPKPTSESSTNLSDFKYPNSTVTTNTTEKIGLSSGDSPSVITSWYENKLKELGYSSRASAKTNTNGNITNKLGGGKNNSSVTIEIVKKANENSTFITVTTGSESNSDVHIKIQNGESYM